MNINKIIVVLGPTGVGKTKLSLELARLYNGEIINADAMQVYQELNIGTAKITDYENIPHHLIDFVPVSQNYTVYHYQENARRTIKDIQAKEKTPIIVGGTGLYIKACLYDYQFNQEENNQQYQDLSLSELQRSLLQKDPNTTVDLNNSRRIIRALNNLDNQLELPHDGNKLLYQNVYFIGLTTNRDNLYNLINKRVDKMIEDGLIEEAKKFFNNKIFTKPLTSGIGYKELYQYFDNQLTKEEAIELIKKNSRHYAKRQYTFFNNQLDVKWFDVDYNDFNNTVNEVVKYINESK